MSIATEISRIQQNISKIRGKLIVLGLASDIDTLDQLSTAVASIVNNGAVNAEVKEGETYNIPVGYHNGSGTVAGVAGGGNYKLQQKEVTPTKEQQTVSSDDGYYGLSSVTVEAIPTIYQDVSMVTAGAGDVLTGKTFVTSSGVATVGEMANNGPMNKTIDGMSEDSVEIPSGFTSGGTVSLTDSIEKALKEI